MTIPYASNNSELIYIYNLQSPAAPKAEKGDIYILANLAIPDISYGLMAGYQVQRYGGYVSFRSSFTSVSPSYSCTSNGMLDGGGRFWAGGEERSSNMSVCAGALYGLKPHVSIYAGAGYGSRKLVWKDVDGQWAEVSDWSCKGWAIEAGTLFSWKKLAFSLGVSSVSLRTAEFVCGVGLKF